MSTQSLSPIAQSLHSTLQELAEDFPALGPIWSLAYESAKDEVINREHRSAYWQIVTHEMPAEYIKEMRGWVKDCQWADDTTELSDLAIIKGIDRHFNGGLKEFINCMA